MGMMRRIDLPEPGTVPLDFRPTTVEEAEYALSDPIWRVCSGYLYRIMTKADEYDEGNIVPFIPNEIQRDFMAGLRPRNVVLKGRQHGITTMVAILWTDHALFVPDQRCAIIAHNREDAEVIFRDKVMLAIKQLPDLVRETWAVVTKETASEVMFANNSSIRVATSARSGTYQRLHVSEMGKISAAFPKRAREVVTGSFPAVPSRGVIVVESTAEGRSGEFYELATRAERRALVPRPLGPREWKFHFYGWQANPRYTLADDDPTPVSPEQHAKFDKLESQTGERLRLGQRKWYVATLENDQSGDPEKMWREYPTTPAEAWQRSVEGTYYARQIARVRAEGRLTSVPFVSNVPVHTFWDIGAGDGTGIWLMQRIGSQYRFPLYVEAWSEGYGYFVRKLRETGQVFGTHYLPHDATHKRQVKDAIGAPLDFLQELAPDWTFQIVPRVVDIHHGIQMTRDVFHTCWFDAEGCKEGFAHLEAYRKKFNHRLQTWSDDPEKGDGHSEAADAFRQFAQGFDASTAAAGNPYADLARQRRRRAAAASGD